MDAATKSESPALSPAFRDKLIALVGPENVRPTTASDAISGIQPHLVVEPGTEKELAEILRFSDEAGLAVVPRGGGTKLSWGNPPSRADILLSTARLDKIIEHAWADLTVSVEAGCTLKKLQETLAEHGQRLALDALWPEKATIGGALTTNDSGVLRLRFGSFRDLIIGVTIALPDGTLASSGGKVVKNVAGYDIPKLVTGAFGTLGVITRAVFRLHPLPHNTRTLSIAAAEPRQLQQLLLAIQNSKLAHTALQARFATDAPPTAEILFEGTDAGLNAQEEQLRKLAAAATIAEVPPSIWNARRELCSFSNPERSAIAKFSILPAEISQTVDAISNSALANKLRWQAVVQATGIGWLRLEGIPEALLASLQGLRLQLERNGGSLVVFHRPPRISALDAWGAPGDSLPLMKAVKLRLDPKNTLNPGRFVGGI